MSRKYNKTKTNNASEIEALTRQLAELQARLARLTTPAVSTASSEIHAITRKGNWLWISFTAIPSEGDRALMKSAGARFSGKRRQWYIPCRTTGEATEIEMALRKGGVEALAKFPATEETKTKTKTRRIK